MKNIGAYIIFNAITGDCYIGSTNRLANRFNEHRSLLNRGAHYNRLLQALWTEMDGAGFCFSVVELCEAGKRISVEQKYIDMYKPSLNISPTAGSCAGVVQTEEAKRKRISAQTGEKNVWFGRGKEMPFYGVPISESRKKAMSERHSGAGNPMYGVTPSHAKMTPDDVRRVRALIAGGMKLQQIADMYGVSKGQVAHIKHGRSYKGVV